MSDTLETSGGKYHRQWTPVWMKVGSRAYWRSFRCGRFSCTGGGRDFFWLTLLLALVISMALLLVGSRAGLLERFTDALLGTLRPHGVPVWVTSHWENHEGIQTSLLAQLKDLERRIPGTSFGLTVHPYRRLAENNPRIMPPEKGVWDSGTPWVGWGVYPKDPLWEMGASSEWKPEPGGDTWQGLPLSVVLSESLFAKHFNYAAYRTFMQPILREKKLRRLPPEPPHGDLKNALNTLWLKVMIGNREELLPFRVRWVHHIPSMEKVAYLFPLTTYHALLAAYHFPDLRYDPANLGRGDKKQHEWLTAPGYPRSELAAFALCVQREVAGTGLLDLPQVKGADCPKPALPDSPVAGASTGGGEAWDTLDHDAENRLWLPCGRLPQDNTLRGTLCTNKRREAVHSDLLVPWDVTDYGTAFAAVHVYVPDPTRLRQGIAGLLALRTPDGRPALNIHPMYQDALNRFNLLSDLLSTMVPAYALTFGLFLASLLLAQVGALIGHRRHHYGILLSRGFTALGIYAKLTLQMALATFTGGVLAVYGMIPALRLLLEDGFNRIIARYLDLLPPGYNFEVLPLPWRPVVLTIGQVFVAVVLVTLFVAFRLPLRGNTAPSDLLHGDGRMPRGVTHRIRKNR